MTPLPTFPRHAQPRVWLITSAPSPTGTAIARAVLAHGDSAVLGVKEASSAGEEIDGEEEKDGCFAEFWEEVGREGWKERCRIVQLDGRCEFLEFDVFGGVGRGVAKRGDGGYRS